MLHVVTACVYNWGGGENFVNSKDVTYFVIPLTGLLPFLPKAFLVAGDSDIFLSKKSLFESTPVTTAKVDIAL